MMWTIQENIHLIKCGNPVWNHIMQIHFSILYKDAHEKLQNKPIKFIVYNLTEQLSYSTATL